MLGGLSMTEIIIILALALLLLGPDQLPSLARSLGKGLRELRKATDDIKGQFESEIARIDLDQQPQKSIAPVPSPDAPKEEAAKALEPPRSRRREPGAPPQAGADHRSARRRRPALAPRSPDGAAEAPEVGADLADARIRRVVLLVAADLPLHDAADFRGAAGGRTGAALRLFGGTVHHLPEGGPLLGALRLLALHLLADLDVRRAGPLSPRAAQDRAVRAGGHRVLRCRSRVLLPGDPAAGFPVPDQHGGSGHQAGADDGRAAWPGDDDAAGLRHHLRAADGADAVRDDGRGRLQVPQ